MNEWGCGLYGGAGNLLTFVSFCDKNTVITMMRTLMRTLDRTVSIGLLTGKTARVRPSETLKRYIRDSFQPKCTYRDKLRYQVDSTICQLCKEQPETVAHILVGCLALAQNHYTARHNAGLKCLYFTLMKH